MNRAAAISFVFLIGSAMLNAQNTSFGKLENLNPKAQPGKAGRATPAGSQAQAPAMTTAEITQLMNGCPVSMRARHTPGGDTMEVNGVRTGTVAQMLHLTVTNRGSRQVVAASVTVRGFANKPRVVQTMSNQDQPDAAKTQDVRFKSGPGREVSGDLAALGLSAATEIELNSVTYADGSTWKLAAGNACRTPIDGFMLIDGR